MDTIIPIEESGPYSLKISSTKLTAADDEKIRTRNTGIISTGICKMPPKGSRNEDAAERAPDARNIPTDTRRATMVGAILTTI